MVNIFQNDAFSLVNMTAAINIVPNLYGRIQQMGLFPIEGVMDRIIAIEELNGVLNLLPTQEVGAPGSKGTQGKRQIRTFRIPHIPHDDVVLPQEVQRVRRFGSDNEVDGVIDLVNRKLATMRRKHALTLEWLRMGALKGVVKDADNSTVLLNHFTEYGITQKTIDFVLGTTTTSVKKKCLELKRYMDKNLKGEMSSGVHVLCGTTFFEKFITHADVEKHYLNWTDAAKLRGDNRRGFEFGDIMWEEYDAEASDAAGNVYKFIEDSEAHAFPVGTMDTFSTYVCPADFNETVNTVGQELYAKIAEREMGRGYNLHTQSNPLPVCKRPALLVKLTTSN